MTPNGIKERFEFYRKWFRTLLINEFLNLPSEYQKRFIKLSEKFLDDCRKVQKEGDAIKEKNINVIVSDADVDTKDENYKVYGKIEDTETEISFKFPFTMACPKTGKKIPCVVYSLDGNTWYSSKKELIEKESK